jgi:mannose-6-phosphate isomerase class I
MNETTETVKEWARGLFNTSPAHELAAGTLSAGYKPLAAELATLHKKGGRVIAIDGYHGTQWKLLISGLSAELTSLGISHEWTGISDYLLPQSRLTELTEPFMGGDDPIFGRIWPLGIEPFFDAARIAEVRRSLLIHKGSDSETLHLVCGTGASLIGCQDACWYSDVSKQQQQQFCREGILTNWTSSDNLPFGSWYKRSYYVEWPVQNKLKQALLPEIDRFIDFNNPDEPVSISGDDFRNTLAELSRTPFRPRPWFAPGPWGGQFMKGHMGLDSEEPNFAWSFELIAPENGVLISSGDRMLEFSFDYLLYHDNKAVMGGETARRFGTEWPVRFDYLDTIEGGNLSVQVHPSNEYIRSEFGETFTQDETYYISKAEPGARVYLGLKDGADPMEFRKQLELSAETGEEVDIDRFVNSLPAKNHDLFYIPNGTIHCSGAGNMVLEISATPYIYTFKLYDYLRRDLNGNLRPINVDRGFDNLKTDRTTGWVRENLVARPRVLSESAGCTEWVLMDVPYMFYVINRVDFEKTCEFTAEGLAYMVNLVEGDRVEVISENGRVTNLAYLESMVIPASTGKVKFVNKGQNPCKMVKVYVRPGHEK